MMFGLNEQQREKLDVWLKEKNHAEKYGGAIGGTLTFSFTPTTLGVVVEVTENFTNTKIDLTDYDSW